MTRRDATRAFLGFLAGSPLVEAQSEHPPGRVPAAADLVNVFDFEKVCRERVPRDAFEYVSGGAEDEVTMRRNREAFQKIIFRPRMLVDVSRLDLSTELFGERIEMPILVAPTGSHGRLHPDAEAATARAAGRMKTIMAVSSSSSLPLETIAKAATGPLWFQLYAGPDLAGTRQRVEKAAGLGCKAICFTVDAPYFPNRERDQRNRLDRPAVQREIETQSRRAARIRGQEAGTRYGLAPRFTSELSWEFLDQLVSWVKVPVLLKGLLTPEDAQLALEHGASGIVVSNHGGRYLDGAPATMDVLPSMLEAVGGRIPVLIDGGFRRGTDVLKALSLGAKAVLIGRAPLWGLGAYGEEGVARVLEVLQTELARAMGLAGRPTIAMIDRSLVSIER